MSSLNILFHPRIEIVLVPDEQGGISNKPSELFDLYCVLHVPNGKDPTRIRADGGPYDRAVAIEKLTEVLTKVWNGACDACEAASGKLNS